MPGEETEQQTTTTRISNQRETLIKCIRIRREGEGQFDLVSYYYRPHQSVEIQIQPIGCIHCLKRGSQTIRIVHTVR